MSRRKRHQNDTNKTTFDMFEEVMKKSSSKPGGSLSAQDTELIFYQFKLLGVFWFEGDLPLEPNQEISCLFNNDWPNGLNIPTGMNDIPKLSLEEMKFVAARIKKPAWASSPAAFRGTITCTEFVDRLPTP